MNGNIWQGEKIRLRGVEPEDWKIFMSWNLDTEAARCSYFIPFPQSSVDVQKTIQRMAEHRGEDDCYTLVMENRDGALVGIINTHDANRRAGTFSYGVAVQRIYQNRGYAAEAIRLVLGYYFNELRYQKCNVSVYAFNQVSIHLHEKLGFVLEGRLRRCVFTDGQYHDILLYGMTVEEFHARQAS